MSLYCFSLKEDGTGSFLVEADSVEAALDQLEKEIKAGGTPAQDRYVGGIGGHTLDGYRVIRTDEPIDLAQWDRRNGSAVSAHSIEVHFGKKRIAWLEKSGVIFRCHQCSSIERAVYHPVNPAATITNIRDYPEDTPINECR